MSNEVSKNKSDKLGLFVGVAVLCVVALTTVYFVVVQNRSQVQEPVQQGSAVAPGAQSQTQVSQGETTASWQTYTNEQYGFEFKYPIGYEFHKEENLLDPQFYVRASEEVSKARQANFSFGVSITEKFLRPEEGVAKNPQEWIAMQKDMNTVYSQTLVNGEVAYTDMEESIVSGDKFSDTVLFRQKGKVYDMYVIKVRKSSIEEKILSTFRFINVE